MPLLDVGIRKFLAFLFIKVTGVKFASLASIFLERLLLEKKDLIDFLVDDQNILLASDVEAALLFSNSERRGPFHNISLAFLFC